MANIIVVDDEYWIRNTFKDFLTEAGYDVFTAGDYSEAMSMFAINDFDLVIVDIILGDRSGIDILREIKTKNPASLVVMITGYPQIETASEAVRLGAFDYITKPVKKDALLHVVNTALSYKSLVDEKERYRMHLEAIFRSAKFGIITVDKELHLVRFNGAAAKICGFTDTTDDLYLPESQCSKRCLFTLRETIETKKSHDIYRLECKHKLKSGQVVNITTYPMCDEHERFCGGVMIVHDETTLAELEMKIGNPRKYHNIIGQSEKMQQIYSLIETLSNLKTTVLITGENGTGKELIAEAIHFRGQRSNKPLVKVNCSAISEHLLESELFGHVKGAFTDAISDSTGRFQKADSGTIFLDEIGDITTATQLKLMRVLQEMEFEKVGSSTTIKVDVRVIAATNQCLKDKIKRGQFRQDLYYRLRVVEINLPPLKDRKEDIPLLVEHFLEKFNRDFKKEIHSVSTDVMKAFMHYPWPGNIREMQHAIEHAFVLSNQRTITIDDLPEEFRDVVSANIKQEHEPQIIRIALKNSKWNKSKTARLLGIDRKTLYNKISLYGIKKDD
ncbi:sigma 54-interacting transcriptional regulator [Candidatus Magnetomonas plexicatena]|uniref:sigma 54-interacting transcriptional regulator n=1 Tax=Candidatus Magnetomonas plexicatena TaxID=2552947 RepID=UPI004032BEF2